MAALPFEHFSSSSAEPGGQKNYKGGK